MFECPAEDRQKTEKESMIVELLEHKINSTIALHADT